MTTIANIPPVGEPLFYAGTTHEIWAVILESGSPKDISYASIVWILAASNTSTPLVTKVSSDQTQIAVTDSPADPTSGLFVIFLNPVDTATLGGQVLYHEARAVINATNEVVFAGTFTVTPSDTEGLV